MPRVSLEVASVLRLRGISCLKNKKRLIIFFGCFLASLYLCDVNAAKAIRQGN